MAKESSMKEQKWHTMKSDEVLNSLYSKQEGITDYEGKIRLDKYGQNIIEEGHKKSVFESFVDQFKSILIIILIIAVVASAFIGELTDAAVILAIIILNAILGFVQERKAEKALEALKKMSVPITTVVRDGKIKQISSSELVPGDIIVLKVGDGVPADCRILEETNLKIDESLLTGESAPVSKSSLVIKDLPLAERKNMVFSGTNVVYGRCKAVVASTGMNTEFGKIAASLQEPEERTPLQENLDKLGMHLGAIFVGISVLVFIVGYVIGIEFSTILLLSIALAVAAVPEGLPAMVTISLALGVQRMASKKSIVRRLSSVETLGSTDVICTDKTGTLTMNQMTVKKLYVDDKEIDITGEGYDIKGKLLHKGKEINATQFKDVQLLMACGILCNDGILEDSQRIGDPTEIALIVSAKKAGLSDLRKSYKRVEEIEFSSERKMMTTGYVIGDKKVSYTKGAVEEVLRRCSFVYDGGRIRRLTANDVKKVMSINETFSKNALRVLAFAVKKYKSNQKISESDMVFIGLQGMIDPPRSEIKESVELCRKAGIKVVMITGDHKETAIAIARSTGIFDSGYKALTGLEIDRLTDNQFKDIIDSVAVYARVSPQHKVRITEILRNKGHVVAMIGDGINDAPAIKKADIGVAAGTGTDVAKEAADMTLLDDNFATIVSAVKEGRGIYSNIKKSLTYLLSGNIAEVMVISLSVIVGALLNLPLPIPLMAIQILWINLVTDGIPALTLSVDKINDDVMEKKPRKKNETMFKGTRRYILDFPIIMTLCVLGLFIWSFNYDAPGNIEKAQTLVFTAIVLFEMIVALSVRNIDKPIGKDVFSNKFLVLAIVGSIALQLLIIYTPFLDQLFHTAPLNIFEWFVLSTLALLAFAYLEVSKYFSKA